MMPELSSGHTHPLSKENQTEGHFIPILLKVETLDTHPFSEVNQTEGHFILQE